MINSIRVLMDAPYNKQHPFFALRRFAYWKLIRAFKMKGVGYRIWGDRTLTLDYDSLQSMWLMYNYILDWEEFKLIQAYVQPGDQIVDVGANLGAYSVWMSKFITAPGKIHSFEPDETNYQKLQKHISKNNLSGVIQANKMALSETDGSLSFTTGLDRLNHIADGSENNVVTVASRRLDTYFNNNNVAVATYMKIDVEGFEYNVLKGANKLLAEKRIEVVQLEINNALANAGLSTGDILGLLRSYSYTLCSYDVAANQLRPVEYTEDREDYFAVSNLEMSNQKLKSIANRKK